MIALVINSGSSSLKFHLIQIEDKKIIAHGIAEWAGLACNYSLNTAGNSQSTTLSFAGAKPCFNHIITDLQTKLPLEMSLLVAIGHRVVHGGNLTKATLLDQSSILEIKNASYFAPLHNPPALEVIEEVAILFPNLKQIASFDTAFHSTMPREAFTYPIPFNWTLEDKIRRYGFHGLNYAWCSDQANLLLGHNNNKLVICHLGHGASACAVKNGKSIFTTMGLTPLDGLMMGTRSGSIDPGILFHLARSKNLSIEQIEEALLKESGLLGVSGKSADMRQIIELANANDDRAQLAIDIYCMRVQQAIGALATNMGGIDALVFTAGVGENSAFIRKQIVTPLSFLGLELDANLNQSCKTDKDISSKNAKTKTLVIAAREELQMANEIESLLNQ